MNRKFATIDGAGVISVGEGPVPEPGPGEILIEVRASCISSGTELGGIKRRRENPGSSGPRPFGYQNAGDVIAVGSDVQEFKIGDRVACMGGGYALHTTHACVPKNLSVHIPEGLSYEEAALNHLGATALHAIRRAKLEFGENVAVFGLGTVGQFTCQIARLSGAHVMGVDRFPLRLNAAKDMGTDVVVNFETEDPVEVAAEFTRGYGMDCAVMCFGGDGDPAFNQIAKMMKVSPDTHIMGRVVIVGGARISHGFAASLGNLDVRSSARPGPGYHDEEWERGRDYPPVFVQWTTKRNIEEVLRAAIEGKLKVKRLISHEYPLDEAPEACEKIIQTPGETLAVVLKP
jgi:threonine dehydrogenase-like Zn-dependent dehydrogenase